MKITEAKLKQIILEEVESRLREYYEEQAKEMLLEGMPDSWKRAAGILGIGAALIGATKFGADYAMYGQEKEMEGDAFRTAMQVSAEKVKGLKRFTDIAAMEDVAGAPVGKPVGNPELAMEDFQFEHIDDWSNAREIIGGGFGMPQEPFGFVPANQIGDNEVLPFVGMTKADYETLLRAFYLDDPGGQGDQRLEDLVMGGGEAGSSMYWAYGSGGMPLFSFFNPTKEKGERGMMLPPEWSVAYDLLQTRQARAAGFDIEPPQRRIHGQGQIPLDLSPSDQMSIPLDRETWKEMKILIKKELAKLL